MYRCHLLFLLVALTVTVAFALDRSPYNRLYVFGDSYSDIGEGYLDGNGPTAVAYLADRLGFKLLPSTTPDKENQSLDFAVSGAGTGAGAGSRIETALLRYGMQNQVADFAALLRTHQIAFDPATTLFFIAGGLNDGKLTTETTVANLKGEMRTLYSLGARHIVLALLPTAIPDFSLIGRRLNPALALIPQQLATELPDAQIALTHWGPFFDEVIYSPEEYGIRNIIDACAGRAIFHQDTTECSAPGDHFYYHANHPSTAVHKIVGDKLYRELLTTPPQSNADPSPAAPR